MPSKKHSFIIYFSAFSSLILCLSLNAVIRKQIDESIWIDSTQEAEWMFNNSFRSMQLFVIVVIYASKGEISIFVRINCHRYSMYRHSPYLLISAKMRWVATYWFCISALFLIADYLAMTQWLAIPIYWLSCRPSDVINRENSENNNESVDGLRRFFSQYLVY